MKKVISVIVIIAGSLMLLSVAIPMIMGVILRAQVAGSAGIIGSADGPTSVMIVGVLGTGSLIVEVLIGMLLIIGGIWGLKKSKK